MDSLSLDINFLINNPAIREAVRKARLDISGLADGAKSDADRLEGYFSKLSKTLAGVFSVHAAKEFVTELINVRGQFQQIENSLTTILRSQDSANALMKEWKSLTLRSPYTLSEIAQSGKQLLAYGVDAKNVTKNIEQLANLASGVSQPLGDIAYLYGTLKTQGRAYQIDINQFTNRGIPMVAELAKVLKVAESDVRGLTEAGKIGFPEVEKAIANMTGAGGQFFNLIGKQAETLPGQINRLKHEWELMLNEIGTNNESILAGGVSAVANLVEHYDKVIDILKALIITYGAYRTAVILNTVAVSGMSAVEALHYGLLVMKDKLLGILTAKTGALTAATAAYTAVLAALGVIAYAGIQYQTAAEIAENSLTTAREKGEKAALKEQKRIADLTKTIKDHNASKEDQKAAYDELQQTTKGTLDKFTLEEIAAGKADRAMAQYTRTIKTAVSAETEYAQYRQLEEKLKALDEEGIKAVSTMDRLWVSLKRTFAPTSQGLSWGSWWDELTSGKAANKGIVDAETKKLQDAQKKILSGVNGKGVSSLIGGSGKFVTPEEDAEIKRAKQFARDLGDVIGNFDKLMSGAKNKTDVGKIKEAMTAKIEALAPGDAKISEYKAKLQKVNAMEAQYGLSADSKAIKETEKWADKKKDLMDKLAAKSAEVFAKGQTQNQKEILDAQQKYKELRNALNEYNKKAPKGQQISAGTFAVVDNLEKTETGTIKYDQDTDKLKETLEKQKQLYADFEGYVKTLGEAKAKERFSKRLNTEKDYLQRLKDELGNLETKTDLTPGEAKRKEMLQKEIEDEKTLRGEVLDKEYAEAFEAAKTYQQKELDIKKDYATKLDKLLQEQNGKVTADQRANLEFSRDQAIEAAKDEAYQKTAIYRKLAQDTIQYTSEGLKREIQAVEAILKTANLAPEMRKDIERNLSALKLTLSLGVDQSNLNNLNKEKQDLEKALNSTDGNGLSIISEKEKKDIIRRLKEVQAAINDLDLNADGTVSYGEKVAKNFAYMKEGSAKAAEGMSNDLGRLSGSFNELSSALGGSDTQAGYLLGTIGELAKVGSDAAGAFASFATGDIIGGITKTVSAVAGLFSIGKKVKEMNLKARKEQADFYAAAMKGEMEYQALLRKRDLDSAARGQTSYKSIIAQLEALKKQSPEIQKAYNQIFNSLQGQQSVEGVGYKHGTWFRKAKTWDIMASLSGSDYGRLEDLYTQGKLKDQAKADFEALRALKEELEAAGLSVADLQEDLRQLLTGTSTSGLAQGLTSLFENGKRSAKDFGDSFADILRNALLTTFEQKYLLDAMQPFYEELAAMMEGNTPTEGQIEALRQKYILIGEDADAYLKNIEKITGVSVTKPGSQSEGMSDSIKGITANQADILSGAVNGMRLSIIEGNGVRSKVLLVNQEQLSFIKQGYMSQLQIEMHTKRTADNTDQLKDIKDSLSSIDDKMNNDTNYKLGTGRGG